MGKSALAGNILAHLGASRKSGLLFTLEMSRGDIIDRIAAGHGVKYQNIRSGELSELEWSRLTKAMSEIHGWRLAIDDTPAISLRDIRSKARQQKRKGLDLVVIDYLQLMALPNKESRVQGLGEVSRGLKQLARELDVPVVALSQLNRGLEQRNDKRPMMSDLRDSGEIEQDADVILFPFREAAYCPLCRDRVNDGKHNYREHQAKAEIIIEKQRAGERNISVPACWLGEYQKFEQLKLEEY
jgi:replicative DNA helicase